MRQPSCSLWLVVGDAGVAWMGDALAIASPPDWERWTFTAIGFAGQGLFALRMLTQWLASERAQRSVAPRSFWWLSILGTVMLLAYAWFTRDLVFLIAPALNLFLYARNLALSARPPGSARQGGNRIWLFPLGSLLLAGGLLSAYLTADEKQIISVEQSPLWLAIGLAGTALWTVRFPVQWILAERRGYSTLPPAFWWMSLAGSLLLTAYAAYKPDVVFILAYALAPIPVVRNLMLIRRGRHAVANAPAVQVRQGQPDA